jgi:purine-binding chemotaxis protein CheW
MGSKAPAIVADRGQSRSMPAAIVGGEADRKAWLLCRAGTMLCALPIEQVIEIMRPLPIEQIGGAPRYVRGLSVIRGGAIPVVDLGQILSDRDTRPTRLIAVRAAARTIALAVDSVVGISSVAANKFTQLPPLLREAAADTISAIAALDGALIFILEAARLVPEELLARLEAEKAAP